MNEYQKMLHEIEAKKQQLEQRIAAAVQAELLSGSRKIVCLSVESILI